MPFGFALDLSDIDLWNIDLLDTPLDLLDEDIPSKHFVFLHNYFKTSWKSFFKISSGHVFKRSSRHVFKTCSRHVFQRSSRRLQLVIFCLPRHLEDVSKKSSRHLPRCLQDILKTSWKAKNCYTEDELKTSPDVFRRLQD